MAIKFGRIDYSETTFGETTFNKNQGLTSASNGISLLHLRKDQQETTVQFSPLTTSGSHWAFIHNMFYRSGSSKNNTDEQDKFADIYKDYGQFHWSKPLYKTKFYDSGSVVYIPQQYFGERIKPETFQLTARSGSSTNTSKEIIIKDDGNGNLYSTNAEHSQSDGVLSSSANYIGNIFYDLGVVTLTETASWSGSVSYTDIGSGPGNNDYVFYGLNFNSTTPIFTSQYSIKIPSSQFNTSINSTTRIPVPSGSNISSGSSLYDYSNLRSELTGSGWLPYFNQLQLYRDQSEEPVLVANVPRAIKKRDNVDLIITFRLDH